MTACYGSSILAGQSDSGSGDLDTVSDTPFDGFPDVIPDSGSDSPPDSSPDDGPDMELDVDIPEVGDDAVVAELVGPPVALDDETNAGGQITVAWNGTGWGVAWSDMITPLVFRPLDATANPIGPAMDISSGYDVWSASLAWWEGRYGLSFSTNYFSHGEQVFIGVIDENGVILSGPTLVAPDSAQPHVAWSESAGGWLFVYLQGLEDSNTIEAGLFDSTATVIDGPFEIGAGSYDLGPRVVALKSRVSVVWPTESGLMYRGFIWPTVEGSPEPSHVLDMGLISDSFIEATGFFDYTLAVAMDGSDVEVVVIEPWGGTVASGPFVVGHSSIRDRRPSIAAAHERGYLGVCYETGPGPWGGGMGADDGVSFRIVTPYGEPLGAALVVASGLRNIGDCVVGWSGTEFVVIYWSCGGDAAWNTIYAQRVAPLI